MSTKDEAIRFAVEIIRKRDATTKTASPRLKHDYNKSINADMDDLLFYVQCHNLDMSEVWKKAFEFYNKHINTSKEEG
jgi:hypothetical protein